MLSIFSQLIFRSQSRIFGNQQDGFKNATWRDRSLCFDLRSSDLELKDGEQLIACFFPIEDIKGNPDELGILRATNLRLIWSCSKRRRVNLSIGWRTVSLVFKQNLKDPLGHQVTSLCILTKYESTKYEFVFNKMPSKGELWSGRESLDTLMKLKKLCHEKPLFLTQLSPMYLDDPFDVIFQVWHSYKETQLFRFCRANLTSLVSSKDSTAATQMTATMRVDEINKLPSEEVIEIYSGIVQCESRAIKYNGTLVLTNIRLIWIDESLPLRNLSIPYIRINSIKLKQGDKILIQTLDYLATSTQIELRIHRAGDSSRQSIKLIFEQVQNLYVLYKSKPRFGPESCDECINFMSYLRPLEHYFDSVDDSMQLTLENLGPEMKRIQSEDMIVSNAERDRDIRARKHNMALDKEEEDAESELSRYNSRLTNYLNGQPINKDKDLIHSSEFGLAVERPETNIDLREIWRIDL